MNCNPCSLRFVDKSVLERHLSIIHGKNKSTIAIVALSNSEEKSLKCNSCLASFAMKSQLKRHISQVHKDKKQLCNVCEKILCSKKSLKYHTESFCEFQC